jgi:hypothetical protein
MPRPKPHKERAYTKDIAGKKIRTKNFHSKRPPNVSPLTSEVIRTATPHHKNVFPQNSRVVRNPEKAGRRSVAARANSNYTSNPASQPPRQGKAVSNSAQLARLKRFQTNPGPRPKRGTVGVRSASRQYISNRSGRAWARFPGPKRKGERAVTTDLAGKPLRTKNYHTQRPGVLVNPTARYRPSAKKTGERPYKGPAAGGYVSRSQSGRAWKGDITNRRIRTTFSSKKGAGKAGKNGGGSVGGLWNNNRKAIDGRAPGVGAKGVGTYRGNIRFGGKAFRNQGELYSGNLKTRRPAKGGGSISGKLWNNNRQAVDGRSPGIGARGVDKYQGNIKFGGKAFRNQGEQYSGNLKGQKPLKGGGSVSGKIWNNNQRPVQRKFPSLAAIAQARYRGDNKSGGRGFSNQGEEYSGNIKSRRPIKGGGSISGKLWNNNQRAVAGRSPGIGARGIDKYQGNLRGGKIFRDQGEEFSGNIKTGRPVKGGGSISGHWNNNQTPISGRSPGIGARGIDKYQGNLQIGKTFRDQGEEYSGSIKAKKPVKGGGSVSGKLWNNNEKPIAVRTPTAAAAKAGTYSGNIKAGKRVFNDQGEEFTGWIKQKKYIKNPNAAEASLKVRKAKMADETGGLQIKVRQRDYARRKNAPDGALPGLIASKSSMKAGVATRGMKQYHYVKNGSSADEAMKVREAGKAFARATDFQGNIKMKKFDLFGKRGLHPDAQFVKNNKNNVDSERDMLTNFKLWWARLFRKNETQPDHLKDKQHKPRYDSGERGLWYD